MREAVARSDPKIRRQLSQAFRRAIASFRGSPYSRIFCETLVVASDAY